MMKVLIILLIPFRRMRINPLFFGDYKWVLKNTITNVLTVKMNFRQKNYLMVNGMKKLSVVNVVVEIWRR